MPSPSSQAAVSSTFLRALAVDDAGVAVVLVAQEAQQLLARVVLLDDGVADVRPVEAADEQRARAASCSRSTMSARVWASAVAVSAMRGTSGKRSCSSDRPRYSSRKSWPHWLTQCASSIANRLSRPRSCSESSIARKRGVRMRSGAAYSSTRRPAQQLALDAPRLVGRRASSSGTPACTPSSSSAPTWSCISAISGLTTTRHAAAGAVARDRRHLVAQALAAAGGHQHQRVAAAAHVLDDLACCGPRNAA